MWGQAQASTRSAWVRRGPAGRQPQEIRPRHNPIKEKGIVHRTQHRVTSIKLADTAGFVLTTRTGIDAM